MGSLFCDNISGGNNLVKQKGGASLFCDKHPNIKNFGRLVKGKRKTKRKKTKRKRKSKKTTKRKRKSKKTTKRKRKSKKTTKRKRKSKKTTNGGGGKGNERKKKKDKCKQTYDKYGKNTVKGLRIKLVKVQNQLEKCKSKVKSTKKK